MITFICGKYLRLLQQNQEAKSLQKDTIIVTLDVKSRYIIISNHKGIEAAVKVHEIPYLKSQLQILVLNINTSQYYIQWSLVPSKYRMCYYVLQIRLHFPWENLKKHTFIHTYIQFQFFTGEFSVVVRCAIWYHLNCTNVTKSRNTSHILPLEWNCSITSRIH